MKRWSIFLVAVFLTCAAAGLASPAGAAEGKPILDKSRASLAFGLDYAFYQKVGSEPLPEFKKAWEPGLFGAYVLTPHLTLTGSGAYDLDNKWMRWKVGVRTVLWRGKD